MSTVLSPVWLCSFLGTGSNLQALIDAVGNATIAARIALVVSNKTKAFDQAAREQDSASQPDPLPSSSLPDLIVLAGFMLFSLRLPGPVPCWKNHQPHPALPGQFDGAHAIERALDSFRKGEIKHTGIMVHKVIAAVDRGETVLQQPIPIWETDTLDTLEERIHIAEHKLLVDGVIAMLSEVLIYNHSPVIAATTASLLSSSCCVIQLLLNYLSLGCAGFSILTPYRMELTAISVSLLATTVWKAGLSWKTGLTLCISVCLMLSPDGVATYNDGRLNQWIHNVQSHTRHQMSLLHWPVLRAKPSEAMDAIINSPHTAASSSSSTTDLDPLAVPAGQDPILASQSPVCTPTETLIFQVSVPSKESTASVLPRDTAHAVIDAIAKVDLTYRTLLVRTDRAGCSET
ncbi:hypothetical protein BASA83_008851 [Batrachochytrium salamandrivorans]|nr:hypothetical protein BASA83_008851 [Batrachochytrium salamandrivorans]